MGRLKIAGIVVVAALFAIGTAYAIDQDEQLDTVSSCLSDGGLRVERDDFVVEGRTRTEIPGIDVDRAHDEGHLAAVLFYSDDFEAEKARPLWNEGDTESEQLENILIVHDEPAPA